MMSLLPPAYFLVAMALMVLLGFLFPVTALISGPWRLAGLAPLALGIIFNILADRSFKLRKTTVKPFQQSSVLITDGLFRLSRNPMYLGMVLILIGIAFLLGSLTPWLVIAPFAILLDGIFIRVEESALEDTFGDSYREYMDKVRKWI